MSKKLNNIAIIAAACAMVSLPPRAEYYGGGFAVSRGFGCWGTNHVDYQFGEHPKVQAKQSIKKGYHQQATQSRRKALHKRFERKTQRAKGKIPLYA